jgi:hypothetical protein
MEGAWIFPGSLFSIGFLTTQRKVDPCAVPGAGFISQIAAEDGGFELDVAL